MCPKIGINFWSFARALAICSVLCFSASQVIADRTYEYHDDFNTDKAEIDSYNHSIFWPERAFPPGKPYLYYSDAQGNPPRGLVFIDHQGVAAYLYYRFPIPATLADTNRGASGTLGFDLQFPFDKAQGGYLEYSLSPDGRNWTIPAPLSAGHYNITIASLRGTSYVAFFGAKALIDNVDVYLNSPSADTYVPQDFDTIQEAINAASDGQIIEVAPGTYTGDGNTDIEFRGKAITVRSAGGPDNTIIDCKSTDGVCAGHRGFYFHEGETPDSILQGFTIQSGCIGGSEIPADNAQWNPDATYPVGGGIYCEFSSPTIVNCVIRDCGAEIGGGIGCVGGAPSIVDCTVENCTAGGFGLSKSGGYGGGIGMILGCDAKITNCTVRSNLGYYNSYGGGVYCYKSNPQITHCSIYSNSAPGNITGGGVYYGHGSEMLLRNCLIYQNAAQIGGGIMAEGSRMTHPSRIVVNNCTIAHNKLKTAMPPLPGGGLHSSNYDVRVRNSILWYNEGTQIIVVDSPGGNPVLYSNVQGGYHGQGNIDEDPLFVGISSSLTPDYHLQSLYGRYHPRTGTWVSDRSHSPSIDAGDPRDSVGQEPAPNGNRINMGAYGGTQQASKSSLFRVYHADAIGGKDTNSGLTRRTAFKTIQGAINASSDSDVVLLWPGVYVEQINFAGKAITVQSAADAAVVESPTGYAFSFYTAEGRKSVLRNVVIRNSLYGVFCNGGSPTISNLTVVDNNFGIAAYGGASPDIANCIFWHNRNGDLFQCRARYSRLDDPRPSAVSSNIRDDPLFANPEEGDYHLLSERGRFAALDSDEYGNVRGYWTLDDISSPCVDKGDPTVNPMGERMPNGGRLNMGAYGGTAYASMSEWPLASDGNYDGMVNILDLWILGEEWLSDTDEGDPTADPMGELMSNGGSLNAGAYGGAAEAGMSEWPLASDANYDGIVNLLDFGILAEEWLSALPWVKEPAETEP